MMMEAESMNRETLRFFALAVFWGFALFGAAVLLTGCSSPSDTAKFLECYARDNSTHPCQ